MSRRLVIALVLALAGSAAADPDPIPPEAPAEPSASPPATTPVVPVAPPAFVEEPTTGPVFPQKLSPEAVAPADMSDQAIGAELGIAAGGRVTPGGLRISGHYLYQLSDADWFDGIAAFTFGGGSAECFRDRTDAFICTHGLTQGDEVTLSANVRHFFHGNGIYWPFLRGGIGVGVVRFANDDVTGLAIPIQLGGGLRVPGRALGRDHGAGRARRRIRRVQRLARVPATVRRRHHRRR